MLQTQVNYWNYVENKRHNMAVEEANMLQANSSVEQARAALINAGANVRNADTNAQNALINAANAQVNAQNAETNKYNAETNRDNMIVNRYNAETSRYSAQQSAAIGRQQARASEMSATASYMNANTNRKMMPSQQILNLANAQLSNAKEDLTRQEAITELSKSITAAAEAQYAKEYQILGLVESATKSAKNFSSSVKDLTGVFSPYGFDD